MIKKLDEFIEYLYQEDKGEKTIYTYKNDIKRFIEYFQKNKLEVNTIELRKFKDYLLEGLQLSPKTVNKNIVAIRKYLDFIHINDVNIKMIKIQDQGFLDDILTNSEAMRMIKEADKARDLRAKAFICTLYYTGMRVSEAISVLVRDIDEDSIRILGKGKKYRTVLIPKKLQRIWIDYMTVRVNNSDKLFTGQRGGISRFTALNMVKKYGGKAKVKTDKVYNHAFRHLFCMNLVDRGIPIDVVKDLAGHASILTTNIYTRRSKKQLLDVINQF
ncbi:tyrosine-type recombinase/integrase [Clostridium botulinum]|uniref:tyrosine-type recombinase/integrase n=1 Tax=Clostridium botulinum TaxID=1491 RepID=UPI0004D8E2E7|nr:tyrosine-type recombinase/integrase [Clostridium botulinum]KEH99802.1 putative integrase/recombinase [Clostridium botulinum C/D str. BKT75002]KEI05280.1 putative integrase/recombinase [Clostridium botulinum C/D str. BKT2873]QPW61970.1 tyrosine-type recombinase/integrase [Clostridium botulinum]